ncbi:MAG TPA: aminomethyl-transferring glycine dehydrogenase [Polyangiaceae bacterium]|nr:aminomethyl-transferring glycine dehydrogenase [Polyangiaceae bacterium]
MERAALDPLAKYRQQPDYCERHLGSDERARRDMLATLGLSSLDELSRAAIPSQIFLERLLALPEPIPEAAAVSELKLRLGQNRVLRSFVGLGYAPTVLPSVIRRNILENPGWYTQYTPYQAEIAQGRLEALLNFQTLIAELTGLPLANASLLDEATAAAEAMTMTRLVQRGGSRCFLVDAACFPQTIAVLRTRARAAGVEIVVADVATADVEAIQPFGVLLQYPRSDGALGNPRGLIERAHSAGAQVVIATCPLALCALTSPGQLGADITVGSTQRFGLPMSFGGPHAAFVSASDAYKRVIPGRIVGVSKDKAGNRAYRLALQTREQHIRRERASSNICTAQVLPAIVASFYAVYHGSSGLTAIAQRIAQLTHLLSRGLEALGLAPLNATGFDTLRVPVGAVQRGRVLARARELQLELNTSSAEVLSVTLAETTSPEDIQDLLDAFGAATGKAIRLTEFNVEAGTLIPASLQRQEPFLCQDVFQRYHGEHELLRYMKRLESRDLSMTTSMIPLGSCTMKLNATSAMEPITWPEVTNLHPFTARENAVGTLALISDLERWLAEVAGMDAVSMQPNSGAQGEYTGLLVIRAYYESIGAMDRDVCLIPVSAHGTNPASAVMSGMRVVVVACDAQGNVDLSDLRQKAQENAGRLAALMVTYPSTHGVFEDEIRSICEIVHSAGGQVYLDGANMNAQVGLCRPGDYGADVCHINLHKTFAIPHGGGGPGVGPIAIKAHLAPFLPSHPLSPGSEAQIGPVAAAPFGSAGVLPISWMYMRMMGPEGLRRASQLALLNANYMAKRLSESYPILYRGSSGYCAHEFILDARPLKKASGIEVDDIAKRLMDYGFHAPTMSFPVPGTLMIEPTESESKAELDRLCDALTQIRAEIRAVELGEADAKDNVLKNAPHTAQEVAGSTWAHSYSRELAAFPDSHSVSHKFWPAVGRIDNAAGDRALICTCPPIEA